MAILLGANGSGKTVLLKLILGLLRPDSGQTYLNGSRIDDLGEHDLLRIRADIGMLFQENALFDSLTVARTSASARRRRRHIARRLDDSASRKCWRSSVSANTSTGCRRRCPAGSGSASRSPARWRTGHSLLLFDDPTTGLDPVLATTVDDEVVKLRDLEHVTAILVTHQIRDAFYVATHEAVRTGDGVQTVSADPTMADNAGFMVLHDRRILFEGTAAALMFIG